jgi:hypothetical protein
LHHCSMWFYSSLLLWLSFCFSTGKNVHLCPFHTAMNTLLYLPNKPYLAMSLAC